MGPATSRPRLLVLEDEALVAMLIEDVLVDAGFEVVGPYGQAAKALTSLENRTVDAAILDVNLGGGERSYSVANNLSERGVPYKFLTGYGRVPHRLRTGGRRPPLCRRSRTAEAVRTAGAAATRQPAPRMKPPL
jgi:CheY-like chemotaxis protein